MTDATRAKQASKDLETAEGLSGKADDVISELCDALRCVEATTETLNDDGLSDDERELYTDELAEERAWLAKCRDHAARTLSNIATSIAAL